MWAIINAIPTGTVTEVIMLETCERLEDVVQNKIIPRCIPCPGYVVPGWTWDGKEFKAPTK